MTRCYKALSQIELDAIGGLVGFTAPTWQGPALPRPDSDQGLDELLDMVGRIGRRGQALIQAKDGLSRTYTLRGITDTAERFTMGTRNAVERAAAIDVLVTAIGSLRQGGSAVHEAETLASRLGGARSRVERWLADRSLQNNAGTAATPASDTADYSAFALEEMSQYSMGWTTLHEVSRLGFAQLDAYVTAATDPDVATDAFWPSLNSTALPYNLLVLRRLGKQNAEPFRTGFGSQWTGRFDEAIDAGRLYGIDMTIFAGLPPLAHDNGTTRFTPSTMALLEMSDDKTLRPVAVLVVDPLEPGRAETYTPQSSAWLYGLFAVKTSLTVFGIWLGHVYTLHLVTAAMQMAMWNTLPGEHIVAQTLRPQSDYLIAFDLLLLLGWSQLAPPTSIGDSGHFLELCGRYAAQRDFFSTDPNEALVELGLDVAAFTSDGGAPWDLYPNVQKMLRIWDMTERYAEAVVTTGYADDNAVANDTALQNWIGTAAASDGGNVRGLPALESRNALVRVLTSILYRINFHAVGRLRDMGAPAPSFAPNFPPCLQTATIPGAGSTCAAADLLRDYLPRTGTVGELVSFYDLFAFCEPYTPMIPDEGIQADLFFDPSRFPAANTALVALRSDIVAFLAQMQPDWVEIGQWPRNIEL